MTNKFATAHEWLSHAVREGTVSKEDLLTLCLGLDSDVIQDMFQSQMDEDGYFDEDEDNRHNLYNKVCEQYGSLQHPNPPMRVYGMPDVAWKLLFDYESIGLVCLVYLYVENEIGIVHQNIKGYTPTPCVIDEGVDGEEAVRWFNENVLGLSNEDVLKITVSSMRS